MSSAVFFRYVSFTGMHRTNCCRY